MVFILFAFLVCALAVDGAGWSPWQGGDGGSSFTVIKPTTNSVDYITTICVQSVDEPPYQAYELVKGVWAKYKSGLISFSQGYGLPETGDSNGCLTVNSGQCFNGVQTSVSGIGEHQLWNERGNVTAVASIKVEKSDDSQKSDISSAYPDVDVEIHRALGECMTAIKLYSYDDVESGTILERVRFYFEPIQGVGQNVLVPENHLFPDGNKLVFDFGDQWTYWPFMGILAVISLVVLVAAYCLFVRSERNRKVKYHVVAIGTESDLEEDALRR